MTFYYDRQRHLVCVPYSVENLHKMAAELKIKKCWFTSWPYAHYDIPFHKVAAVEKLCTLVRPREILAIIKGSWKMKKPKKTKKPAKKPTLKEKWGDPRIVTASNDPYGRP